MRILITGACGMLGKDLIETLSESHELYLLDVAVFPRLLSSKFTTLKTDITDAEQTYRDITRVNPDIVIHTAAFTDVDGSETNRDLAIRVNALGTRNVALACQRFDTELVYISSDYVFRGDKEEPYLEFDEPDPQCVYGLSKYWGEMYVRALLNRFYIVRTSWLFGKGGENFVSKILNLAREKKEIEVVNDQTGSPTYTRDLAGAIAHLIRAAEMNSYHGPGLYGVRVEETNSDHGPGLYGVWHITNSGQCSWYEFAREILSDSGTIVKPITSEKLNRPAKRPRFSVLDNYVWRLHGWEPLRHWKEALKDYLREVR